MLEFVFFHDETRDRFIALLDGHGIPWTAADEVEGRVVAIPDETDDDLLEVVEGAYTGLMDLDQALSEQAESEDAHEAAGVVLELQSGQRVYARLPPDLLAKLAQVLTPEELGTLVDAVVDAVEHPDPRPLCARD